MATLIDTSKLPRPLPPTFTSFAAEREQRKATLAAALRLAGRYGFEQGVMGHISVRDPEFADQLWMNPFAASLDRIKASDLLRIRFDGQKLEGEGFVHPGGINTHVCILSANPQLNAVAHLHSVHGCAWSTLDRTLQPISAESAVFYGRHTLYDTYRDGEREKLAEAVGDNRLIIFKNHGLFSVGQSVDEAAYLFILAEKVCQVHLLVEASGVEPRRIDEVTARRISERSHAQQSWLNFQPYYQSIVGQFPDLLD
ncbi:class II aldolase/adducin family protein [Pseudomonas sp. LRF_L74]|uniref:class II aldolase/adducin family protein n=1 Tax=Pseudomonas sp. LRF_L74 TaxID=3369422 RepID=UPI003F5EB734